MATKYISSITLPNGDIANLVDKSSGYTTNTGTVTSVTASGALSSSGGTTPAITHNAPSTSPAKSTQAVYPITIDSYGHITASGTAVTIPDTNLIILNATYDTIHDTYTVAYGASSMSFSDATSALNNGEQVFIKLNETGGWGGTYFEEADYYSMSGTITNITAYFTVDEGFQLYCNLTSSAQDLSVVNLALSRDITTLSEDAYLPRDPVLSGTNLNTIIIPGCYTLDGLITYTNSPMSGTSATLSVIKGTNNTVEQTFKAEDNSVHTYIRFSTDNGSTWTDWREDGGYETYESWSSGSHDANSPKLGLLFCRNGSSYTTNLPSSGTYGYLLTQGRIGANCLQTYVGYSSDGTTGMYIRYYANSQWYPWILIGPGGSSYNNLDEVSF